MQRLCCRFAHAVVVSRLPKNQPLANARAHPASNRTRNPMKQFTTLQVVSTIRAAAADASRRYCAELPS
jgi:hypothetical protein